MSEFCVKCLEKEAIFETKFHQMCEEIELLKKRVNELENENDKLMLDLAFYGGNIINLSCNNK